MLLLAVEKCCAVWRARARARASGGGGGAIALLRERMSLEALAAGEERVAERNMVLIC
jgi:hypothetical protein